MRKFSLKSLVTCCIGLGALVLVLVVFSDKPTALNTLDTGNLSAISKSDAEQLLLSLDENIPAIKSPAAELNAEEDADITAEPYFQVKVKSGDSLSSIFQRVKIPQEDLLAIQKVCPDEWHNQYLDVGQKMKFQKNVEGTLVFFEFIKDRLTSYVFTRIEDTFTAEVVEKKVISKKTYHRVEIKRGGSVISAGLASGIKQEKTLWELPKLLQWDLDFYHDIHPGDSYEILYFENYVEGEYIGDGDIVAITFNSGKTTHQIVRYRPSEQALTKYYTRDGTSTEGQFLRAPLEYTRVSSNFSPRRLHPIHKRYMPHNGIDYAAPTGTPVYATGKGIVTEAGKKRLNGNYVVLKHGSTYQTKYLHLHKIDPKIKVGAKVEQGQRLGTVGMTGAATGPHLHYEFLVNGKHKNPKTVDLPRNEKLQGDDLIHFERHAGEVFSLMASFGSSKQRLQAADTVQ